MPRSSPQRTAARRDEIISACEQLYQTMSFKEITMGEISVATTFSRPSIYNYFHTKEEIFLALLQREYELWAQELGLLLAANETLGAEEFAHALAVSVEHRPLMLKILSMNHFDLEENSRLECLVTFKVAYGDTLKAVRRCLDRFCPWMDEAEKQTFLYGFFPFIYGIYPYAFVTEKQREAMEQADVGYVYLSVYELTFSCIQKLLAHGK